MAGRARVPPGIPLENMGGGGDIGLEQQELASLTNSIEILLRLVGSADTRWMRLPERRKIFSSHPCSCQSSRRSSRSKLPNPAQILQMRVGRPSLEGTYLNWISSCVGLFTIGVISEGIFGSSYSAVSIIFSIIALCFLAYSSFTFWKRARGNFYNDKWGPFILAILVGIAMIIFLAVNFATAPPEMSATQTVV